MSNEKQYKPMNYYYLVGKKTVTKDGHTMFVEDICMDLNNFRRRSFDLEKELEEANWLLQELSSLSRVDIQNHSYKKEIVDLISKRSMKRTMASLKAKK